MINIPYSFENSDANYIAIPCIQRFAKRQGLDTVGAREDLISTLKDYANKNSKQQKIVENWLETVFKEGIKDLYIQNLINEQNETQNANIESLNAEIERYKAEIKKLKEQCNEMISGKYWEPVKNDRGAGRKSIITNEIREGVNRYKSAGMTMREIAEELCVSAALVHKIVHS